MFITERVISLVAPHNCVSCGAEGSLLCGWCLPDALTPLPSRCYKCGKATKDHAVCPAHKRLSPLRHVWVASEYEGIAKTLVSKLKFERASTAAATIAELLDDTMLLLERDTVIVHVPTATTRVRQRGYDQAGLIAQAFAKRRKIVHRTLLARVGQTRQVGAKREQRLLQATTSYLAVNNAALKGARIILMDDIVTTGASLEAAAKVLKQAGAKRVDAMVFASAK